MTKVTIGILGGSSLFHSTRFSSLTKKVVITEHGSVLVHTGVWGSTNHDIVFIQRHHADADNDEYTQPANVNYRAIITALKQVNVDCILGVYSVGSMHVDIPVGQYVAAFTTSM
ncbi:hypothetical protein DYB32_004710 [Aphanomyces invadans]|uniref:Nucleoside phosphorylase domain-containing protein n=1 Tax=Aphanomyces invadans TaxID=157072 RepID=A0A3R6VXL8_9STRA|nr:hypothetical protein DYB32_004710 [Aphanomyces invadans]